MNSFESIFKHQRLHHQQHLRKERRIVHIALSPDSSCIICHPAPLPSTLSTSFRSFLEWTQFILDARQYTGKTVENFQLAQASNTSTQQHHFYKRTFQAFVYNKQPFYTLDQALQLVIQVHNETSAFSLPLHSDLSKYINLSIIIQPQDQSNMTRPSKTVTIDTS